MPTVPLHFFPRRNKNKSQYRIMVKIAIVAYYPLDINPAFVLYCFASSVFLISHKGFCYNGIFVGPQQNQYKFGRRFPTYFDSGRPFRGNLGKNPEMGQLSSPFLNNSQYSLPNKKKIVDRLKIHSQIRLHTLSSSLFKL